MKIIGAGLAGLLAAHAWPQAELFEAEEAPHAAHKALLRFRSEAVAQLTGIPFRPVTVRKGIWSRGEFVQPNILLANQYALKILGDLTGDRSIWSLEPVQRFIAPEDFYEQLISTVGRRIHWGKRYDYLNGPLNDMEGNQPIISTAPLPIVLKALGIEAAVPLKSAAILVERYRVPGADVYQTVYFPDPELKVYRASITGSLLIIECILPNDSLVMVQDLSLHAVMQAFGMRKFERIEKVAAVQGFGKIDPMPGDLRRALLHRLTVERGIFSLGRFATWRNVLLDDVVQDIAVVRRLLKASSYERSLFATK